MVSCFDRIAETLNGIRFDMDRNMSEANTILSNIDNNITQINTSIQSISYRSQSDPELFNIAHELKSLNANLQLQTDVKLVIKEMLESDTIPESLRLELMAGVC